METECSECAPVVCDSCDLVIYENDAEYVCDEHDDSDTEYCSCDSIQPLEDE